VGVTRKGVLVTRTRAGARVAGAALLLPPLRADGAGVAVAAAPADVAAAAAAVAAAAVANAAAAGAAPPAVAAGVSRCLVAAIVAGGRLPSSVGWSWWEEKEAHAPTPKVGLVLCWSRIGWACAVRGALRRSLKMRMTKTRGRKGKAIDEYAGWATDLPLSPPSPPRPSRNGAYRGEPRPPRRRASSRPPCCCCARLVFQTQTVVEFWRKGQGKERAARRRGIGPGLMPVVWGWCI